MKILITIIISILSFSAFCQSLQEKFDDLIRIPYQKVSFKIDFLNDPSAVKDLHIDEYTLSYEFKERRKKFKLKDTTLYISHILKYEDGKLISNSTKGISSDKSLPEEHLEKLMIYDNSGRLSKITTTFIDYQKTVVIEKFIYRESMVEKYDYFEKDTVNPDERFRYYLDKENYIIKESRAKKNYVKSYKFEYNEKKDQTFTSFGQYNHRYEHTYNDFGKKTKTVITTTYKGDGSFKNSGTDYFKYDSSDRLIKEISGEASNHVLEYSYEDDKLVRLTKYSRGELFNQKNYRYDDRGNWIEIEFITNSFENVPYLEKIVKRRIIYK